MKLSAISTTSIIYHPFNTFKKYGVEVTDKANKLITDKNWIRPVQYKKLCGW